MLKKELTEKTSDGIEVRSKRWNDNKFKFLSYFIDGEEYGDYSERDLIKIVSSLDSFGIVPHEYRTQAGFMDIDDEEGNYMIELIFVIGNKE